MKILRYLLTPLLATSINVSAMKLTSTNNASPIVICITGCSSSGKTSVSKALLGLLKPGKSKHIEFDDIAIMIGEEQYDYTVDEDLSWTDNVNNIIEIVGKEELAALEIQKVQELITNAIDKHKHVIFTACTFGEAFIRFLHDTCSARVLLVLAYCPLLPLLEHGKTRNNADIGYEYRGRDSGLVHFDQLFQFRPVYHDIERCGTLSKQELETACNKLCKIYSSERDPETIRKRINTLRDHFFRIRAERVTLCPHLPYDLVIDTSEYTADQCAEKIKAAMREGRGFEAVDLHYASYFLRENIKEVL